MEEYVFKIIGIIGLILIISGIIVKRRKDRDEIYIIGGFLLLIYSLHIKDMVFIVLQIIFIVVAVYDITKKKKLMKKGKNEI